MFNRPMGAATPPRLCKLASHAAVKMPAPIAPNSERNFIDLLLPNKGWKGFFAERFYIQRSKIGWTRELIELCSCEESKIAIRLRRKCPPTRMPSHARDPSRAPHLGHESFRAVHHHYAIYLACRRYRNPW